MRSAFIGVLITLIAASAQAAEGKTVRVLVSARTQETLAEPERKTRETQTEAERKTANVVSSVADTLAAFCSGLAESGEKP